MISVNEESMALLSDSWSRGDEGPLFISLFSGSYLERWFSTQDDPVQIAEF